MVPGYTCLGGKLTFVKESVSYGVPASTQFTNPQKIEERCIFRQSAAYAILPQADPNGLFSPATCDGTWIMMNDEGAGKPMPQYSEPKLYVSTFKFPVDTMDTWRLAHGIESPGALAPAVPAAPQPVK